MKRRRNTSWPDDAGLTILELMIVLVILSLIGAVVGAQVIGQMDRAKVDVAQLQLRQLQNSLTLFQLDTHRYPSTTEGLDALLDQPQQAEGWRGPYVRNKELLADPWGRAVTYSAGEDGAFELASLGSDGKQGGTGAAADIFLGAAE